MTNLARAATILSLVLFGTASAATADPLGTIPAGSTLTVGSLHRLIWSRTAFPEDATLALALSQDGGASYTPVRELPNTGLFIWSVAGDVDRPSRLKISHAAGTALTTEEFRIAPSQAVDYEWKLVTAKAEFAPRDGAGALTYKGRLFLLGGWNPLPAHREFFPRICNNEVWSSTDGRAWTLERANTHKQTDFNRDADWEGRHTAGYAVYKDRMWIIGGDVNQGHYQKDVWSSTDGRTWTLMNKDRPLPWGERALHYTNVFRDKLWIIGGQTMPSFSQEDDKEQFFRDVWTSDDGVNWTELKPREPYWSPRGMIGGSAVLHNRLWVLGGGTYDTPTTPTRLFFNDVWSTADGVEWKQHTAAAPWEPRQYHEVAAYDGRVWVLEGYYKANRNDVWYSNDGLNWYEVPATPWKPRHAASVFVHDGSLWMVAGNNMESDVWRLQRKTP